MKKRKWKRWVLALTGKFELSELVDIARRHGMECIRGFKMSMCVHHQIGLFGTSVQMQDVEKEWIAGGHKFANRQPSGAFSINVDIDREE